MGNHLIIWIFTKKWEPLIRSNERMKKIWTQISWRIVWSPRYPKHWSRNKVLWENGLESWSHLWLKIKFLQLFHRDWWIFQYSNSIFEKKKKDLRILYTDLLGLINVHRMPGLFVPDIVSVESAGYMNHLQYWFEIEDVQTFWSIPMTIIGM